MKITTFLILACICIGANAQIKTTKLSVTGLPKKINYIGQIIDAVKWSDSLGQHIVITTETGALKSRSMQEEGFRDAALYAYHYVLRGDSTALIWKVYDYNKECPVDLELSFINKTFAVTDLDKNNVAEIWLMYRNGCHGDVSPVPTKIIMYEGDKKYVLRGESKVKVSASEFMGGEATLDYNFRNSHVAFRAYAEEMWNRNQFQK